MRRGLVRALSTSRRVAQQPLFAPYEPELNETQKKAIRRIALQNAPQYHGQMNKDAEWIVRVRYLYQLYRTGADGCDMNRLTPARMLRSSCSKLHLHA